MLSVSETAQDGPIQNVTISVSTMILSGLLAVAASMVLAYPEHQAREQGERLGTKRTLLLIAIHVTLLALSAFLGILGTIYGPVAIAVPVQTGAQLIWNMLAMGLVLRMRSFNKTQRIGTYVVSLSVLSLVDVGPGTQNNQNIPALLSSQAAIVWILLIHVVLVVVSVETIQFFWQRRRQRRVEEEGNHIDHDESLSRLFFVLLIGCTLTKVAMATCGKCLGYLEGSGFVLAASYYLVSALLGLLFSITSSTYCDQGLFTPACAAALIWLNMFTGIIIWEDGKVIHASVGYFCALLLTCCGVYLLADIDLLKEYLVSRMLDADEDASSRAATILSILEGSRHDNTRQQHLVTEEANSTEYQILEQQDEVSTVSAP